jgi:hypothetical protein
MPIPVDGFNSLSNNSSYSSRNPSGLISTSPPYQNSFPTANLASQVRMPEVNQERPTPATSPQKGNIKEYCIRPSSDFEKGKVSSPQFNYP